MNSLSEISDYLSDVVDYINNYVTDNRYKYTALMKLEEAVFWITYLEESDEDGDNC